MGKTSLIIKREYLTRVRKKSFILMTILGPLLIAGAFLLIMLLSQDQKDDYKMLVLDDTTLLTRKITPNISKKISITEDTKHANFEEAISDFKNNEKLKKYDFLLWLPENITKLKKGEGRLIYRKAPGLEITKEISTGIDKAWELYVIDKNSDGDSVFKQKFMSTYHQARNEVSIKRLNIDNLDENGVEIEKDSYEIEAVIGLGFALTIFMFIFGFGSLVMRGVIEEKTSRIVEVIISSVKPFQLMLGKIVGVGLVGLTQFVIWGILGSVFTTIIISVFGLNGSEVSQMSTEMLTKESMSMVQIDQNISAIIAAPWLNIILSFLFYFLGGYLIYSALFAAIGAAVDNETDSQQFVLPIITPLLFTIYIVAFSVFKNPNSEALYWLSFIPLTSPVAMLVRIATGSAELWEVLVSMVLLVGTFILTTWIAGKVYRTGILMYGKKPSYKEIFKWIRHN